MKTTSKNLSLLPLCSCELCSLESERMRAGFGGDQKLISGDNG
jgi:hypothetical protein